VIVASSAVLLACLAWILHGPADVLPPYVLGFATGVASGAAMLPYTIIKEANLPEFSGTATGVCNFLNLGYTAIVGPIFAWLLTRAAREPSTVGLAHYQTAFEPMLYGVALAIGLTLLLRETGPAVRRSQRHQLRRAS
jgi:hypothetical protein